MSEPEEYTAAKMATIAIDYGSTKIRAICTRCDYFEPRLIMLDPYLTKVSMKSLDLLEQKPFANNVTENQAWVKLEENYYALGFLAQNNYRATLTLEPLKIDLAIPQTLGIIGNMANKLDYPSEFSINLGILLPWGEYVGRDRLEGLLAAALSRFIYRGKEYSVKLNGFYSLPEGGGLFARGRPPRKTQQGKNRVWIVNIGYRNASLLFVERGNLVKGFTSDLGFSMCIEKIKNYTSGCPESELLAAICQNKTGISDRTLSKLIKSSNPATIAIERERLREAKEVFVGEYLDILSNWCSLKMQPRSAIALAGGGTGHYLKSQINQKLTTATGIPLYWCNLLEQQVRTTFGIGTNLSGRLTDLYGFFFYLVDRLKQNSPTPQASN